MPLLMICLAGIALGVVGLLVAERGRLLRRSTWATLRLARSPGPRRARWGDLLHTYLYSRWTNQYIGWAIRWVFPRLKLRDGQRAWADHYHGKVLTQEQAEAFVTLDRAVPLQDLEQIIPYPLARDLVLNSPPEIAAYECACRHARAHPCQPTQVCMVIGQPFVDFLLEHHPHTSRRLTQAEALDLLRAEHARGHLHAAYFKDVMLNRCYAICNCCKCCCGGIEAMVKHGVPMLAASGYVAQADPLRCQGCGLCADVCPFDAITVEETSQVDWAACMGCGVCVDQCEYGALALTRDARKGIPLDVRTLAR